MQVCWGRGAIQTRKGEVGSYAAIGEREGWHGVGALRGAEL